MSRRRRGKLAKLDRPKLAPGAGPRIITAKSVNDAVRKSTSSKGRARYYRGPDCLVTWQAGRFTIEPAEPAHLKAFAPCPKGLDARVAKAIKEGKTHG